jgi:hypothetical protein
MMTSASPRFAAASASRALVASLYHFQSGEGMQHLAQAEAEQGVVVGGDDADHGVAPSVWPDCGTFSGKLTESRVPSPGLLSISRLPPSAVTRSAIPSSPKWAAWSTPPGIEAPAVVFHQQGATRRRSVPA